MRQQRQAHDAGMALCNQWLKKDILKTEWEQNPKEPRDCRFRQSLGSFLFGIVFDDFQLWVVIEGNDFRRRNADDWTGGKSLRIGGDFSGKAIVERDLRP